VLSSVDASFAEEDPGTTTPHSEAGRYHALVGRLALAVARQQNRKEGGGLCRCLGVHSTGGNR